MKKSLLLPAAFLFAAAIQAQRDQIARIAQELGIKPKVQP